MVQGVGYGKSERNDERRQRSGGYVRPHTRQRCGEEQRETGYIKYVCTSVVCWRACAFNSSNIGLYGVECHGSRAGVEPH